jgi:hypothetical protein
MENIPNVNQIIMNKLMDLEKGMKLLLSLHGKANFLDEFNIQGLKKAAKILGISKETLQNKIKKGNILKNNKHYRISDGGRYFFSESALLLIKGLI